MRRAFYLILLLSLAAVYYYVLGAGPTPSEINELEWWRPRGWALRLEVFSGLADLAGGSGASRLIPSALFALPPLALLVAGVRLFRGALSRIGICALCTTLCAFSYYGFLAPGIWRFFSWRWPLVTLSMATVLWSLLLAPSLVRSAQRRSLVGRVLAMIAAGAAIYLPSVEITGTNFRLPLNLSPWPVITMFGFLLFGYLVASLHLSVGLGALVRSRIRGPAAIAAGVVAAGIVGAACSQLVFSDPTVRSVVFIAALGSMGTALVLVAVRDPSDARVRGGSHVVAAVLLLGLIFVSDEAATRDQLRNRDVVAPVLLDALALYYEKSEFYPDELVDLVPEYIAEIPPARIGLFPNEGEEFLYTNLGDSYVLEFACSKWVQCAYSPPFRAGGWGGSDPNFADPNTEAADGPDVAAGQESEGESLQGKWSCDPRPPELW